MQPNLYWQKVDQRLPKEKRGGRKGLQRTMHKESFWGDGYVHYIEFTDGFTSVYMSKLIKVCI